MAGSADGHRRIPLGRVSGVFGLQGWVRVFSETQPREAILRYSPWLLGDAGVAYEVIAGRRQGKSLVAQLKGILDPDQAALLVGQVIAITRDRLPPADPDEFYWTDLEGLQVVTLAGVELGRIERLFSTGANDVLVVRGERERLIPFIWQDVIQDVCLDSGVMRVDWDPDF